MTQENTADNGKGFVVGIDAGGTSVRLVIANATTGAILEERQGDAADDGGPESLFSLVTAPLPHAIAICAGITKFTRTGVVSRWEQALTRLFPQARYRITPDYVIAFHGGHPTGIGIAVIAGTGSVVYGENGHGDTVRVGGRGWEYGDEGSGAHLTTEAIRRTLRSLDGLLTSTPLTQAVCQYLRTTEPAELAERARQNAVEQGRGFLVPLVLERAQMGDKEAANLFVGVAGWLGASARAAHQRLGFAPEEPVSLCTIGGLWSAGSLLTLPFTQVVHRWMPEATVTPPEAPPVVGAVRLATRLIAD